MQEGLPSGKKPTPIPKSTAPPIAQDLLSFIFSL
jgi:hypothetical protein